METKPIRTETQSSDVVIDRGVTRLSDLWKREDYWAIWLGFILLFVGMAIYLPRPPAGMQETIGRANTTLEAEAARAPFKTIEWYQATDAKAKLRATNTDYGKAINKFLSTPQGWVSNPLNSLFVSAGEAEARRTGAMAKFEEARARETAALARAQEAQAAAAAEGFENEALNSSAEGAIGDWRQAQRSASDAKRKTEVQPFNQIPYLIGLGVLIALMFGVGMKFMGHSFTRFLGGFPFIFLIAVISYMISQQSTMKYYGIEYAVAAIVIGLIISNTVGTPRWVMPAVQVEYYIKTGLVLLGAEVLFGKIVAIGIPGIFVAWVVTPIVLITTFAFGQKILKMPSKTLNMTISADMSVCGVSAAIATAAACRAKKEELTLAIGLSMVFTSVMMIAMPAFIKAVGIPQVLGGAWMGGTIDATGAVAAAGAFLGERALYVAATVKMIQNVMIGVIAFGVAVYWCAKVDCVPGPRVSAMEIWHRFPKFVLGFIGASIIFSLLDQSLGTDVSYALVDHGVIRGFSSNLRGWFFCLAFVSIGLATNFRELAHYFKGGKPLILYIVGQSFNLMLTLIMAYIMFYKVFPEITARI
jgi:uncharacterized membrane protein YadS